MDESSANESVHRFLIYSIYERESWLKRCPAPCMQTSYQLKTSKFHKFSFVDQRIVNKFEDKGFSLNLKYESFVVERNTETLRYDLVDFLTQAGGNLGLFLGCSCFSILLFGVNIIRELNIFNFF